ncbi:response regulator, partial [Staphylococcus hominis]
MSALQGLRVLVVENDAMSASLLEMQLMHAGAVMVG